MDAPHTSRAGAAAADDALTRDGCLERARRGDLAAFRELMGAHQARVFSVALRFTGQRSDAEELLQDVFLQLHAALAQITNEEHLVRWLLRSITHRCIDRQRHADRRPRLVPMAAMPPAFEPAAAERDADPLLSSRLHNLLLQLAPDARAVMLLRFQQDLDPADIAELLPMPVATVKSHLRRSLEWLRSQLEGDEHGT